MNSPSARTAQLALNLRLRDGSSFENFYPGANVEALEAVRALLAGAPPAGGPRLVYLWGEPGCGKTHLLEAACRVASAHGRALYFALGDPALAADALEE